LSSALIYAMSIMGSANSAEINMPGFTGTAQSHCNIWFKYEDI